MKQNEMIFWIASLAVALAVPGCRSGSTPQSSSPTKTATPQTETNIMPKGTPAGEAGTTSPRTQQAKPNVVLVTTLGKIVIELDPAKAPVTVENFLGYVKEGLYDGRDGHEPTVFHRVIPRFMIQGGGLTSKLNQKKTHPPIANESANGLKNNRGTIAMARTSDPDSATSQFFINVADNDFLNYVPGQNPGYAVFGKVVEGMDIVDAIVAVPTANVGHYQNVPAQPVLIQSAQLADAP
jgi:peptidyl-prolyl cis-trans isomerase A (cyclophilin A)